jgi:hypothetical protein
MTSAAKEAQVSHRASVDESIEATSPSYLYPHSWPPGTQVPKWPAGTATRSPRAPAVIGNELRLPAVWCEFGACIERFSHPDALGMLDIRAQAEAVGWREDAFGRLACPRCQQADPAFRATYAVVPWSRFCGQPGRNGEPLR